MDIFVMGCIVGALVSVSIQLGFIADELKKLRKSIDRRADM